MDASEVCPIVDAINAFVEYLVDPMLQEEHYVRDDPPLSLQEKVAKQVHSVVLLYNYYHKKQNPDLEFLRYREFCKMIMDLRPILLPYMKFTPKRDYDVDLIDVEQQLSLTEKEIMNAYHICTTLDASKIVPDIKGWPISKVAVLLVDSKKENCFLRFSSITDGVWSLIEKKVDTTSQIYEVTSEIEFQTKKKRVVKKRSKDGLNEAQILQVGYSAVKEVAGVNVNDIMLLESHIVYSHSEDRTTSRFYMMKCSQFIDEGFIQVPLKDLIQSVRGPLLERSSNIWKVTPTVKYFHMLPYYEIISEWISREKFSDSLQDSKLLEKEFLKLEVGQSHVSSEGMYVSLDNKSHNDTTISLNEKEKNCYSMIIQCGSVKEDQHMDADKSRVFSSENIELQKLISNSLKINEEQNKENPVVQSNGAPNALKVYSRRKFKKRGMANRVKEGNYGGDAVSSHSHGAPMTFKVYSRRNKKKCHSHGAPTTFKVYSRRNKKKDR